MRPWMEKWGSVALIFLCALVILFSALYTRQDDLRRAAARNVAADQSERLADTVTPGYLPPVQGKMLKPFRGAYKSAGGLWRMDPYVHYAVKAGEKICACSGGEVIKCSEGILVIRANDALVFQLRGSFAPQIKEGENVSLGQQIAVTKQTGEVLLSFSVSGRYVDPQDYISP